MSAEQYPKTLLNLSAISKSFGGQKVLNRVNFDLREGEVHILAGENGAGKSTLIKIIAGVHSEYEGALHANGTEIKFKSPQDAARHGIAAIHQELSLIPAMSVSDNIFLGRERTSSGFVRYKNQYKHSAALLDQLALDIDSSLPASSYPLSVQQTFEIAKALAFDAKILIMDEPTSALSEPDVVRLFRIVEDLKARGCGIIYISHKMEEIYQIADRITVLRDGENIGTSRASDLSREKLVQWMVGREMSEQFPARTSQPGGVRLGLKGFSVADPAGSPRLVVDKVSFTLRAGEVVGIGGLQGAGASELLHGLFGTYRGVTLGDVELDGKSYTPRSPHHAISKGMVLLTNDRKESGLVLNMSVTENLTLPSLRKYSPAGWLCNGAAAIAARKYRESFNIRCGDISQAVGTLSGGNQQKVALAKWLATKPRVLLLDEPTRGVDVGAKHEIYEMMNDWKHQGIAILLITSEMPELLALSDRILVMHRGRLSRELLQDEATPERILKAAMGST